MDTVDDYSEVQMSSVVKLTDGIDMRKLIDDSFTTFKVDVSDNVENNVSYFDKDELLQCVNFDCINADSDEDSSSVEPEETPFKKIASKMTNLTQDGKVKKREIQPGSGCIVPERALVTVHYNAYVEYGDEPYDSTWLRGYPKMGHLGQSFIIGLDIGIASMKKGETSRFLLHPDVAYGKLGCPPRIPQNAELLFEVELVNFTDDTAAKALEGLRLDDCEIVTFDTIFKAAQVEHLIGNELFKKDQFSQAINKYRKAVKLLEKCNLKDEKDEAQQRHMLLKLYINLAVCYNKQKASRRACVMCKSALDIQPRNAKALFNFGRALLMLSDFDQAKCRLIAAQRIEPENIEISSELKKLDKKQKMYEVGVKTFSQRMFNSASEKGDTKPKSKKCVVSADFEDSARTYLTEFRNDGEKSQMPLPTGLTTQEEFCIRQISQQLGLIVFVQECRGEKITYVSKPEPE